MEDHMMSNGGAFGLDRTNHHNSNNSIPRPSKRAPAGRGSGQPSQQAPLPMFHNEASSPFTSMQQFPQSSWPPQAAPVTTPPSQSPVPSMHINVNAPSSANNNGSAPSMEAFKNMVMQMASFFQQHPDATMPPGFEGLFSQMNVTGSPTVGNPQAPVMPQPAASTPPSFTTSQAPFFHDDAIVDASAGGYFPSAHNAAPKPQRRALAEAPALGTNSAAAPFIPHSHGGSLELPHAGAPYTNVPSHHHNNNRLRQNNNTVRPDNNNGQYRGGPHPNSHNGPRSSAGRHSNSAGYSPLPPVEQTEPKIVVLVEFKRQRMKKYESHMFVAPGQYVVVEGDRGLDCGFVIHCCVREVDGSYSKQESIDNVQVDVSRIKSESGKVLRLARDDDVKLLHGEIASSELMALKTCRDLAARMNLNMEIVDCEYQFDKKKISFYFEAPHSVDFRELNTELFRQFGVRIWLENLNSKVKNVVPEGALSHADKLQYTKNGLRPPRRAM